MGRRLDHDEVSAEFKAGIDRLQKSIESEIEAFQNEKQDKFNALDVVVMLRLDQIQCLVNDQLPTDQSECIVFTNKGLKSLEQKIKDMTAEVADLQAKCTDVQVLKFGKEIDLEAIEKAAINKEADDLRDKLEKSERERATKVIQWDEM